MAAAIAASLAESASTPTAASSSGADDGIVITEAKGAPEKRKEKNWFETVCNLRRMLTATQSYAPLADDTIADAFDSYVAMRNTMVDLDLEVVSTDGGVRVARKPVVGPCVCVCVRFVVCPDPHCLGCRFVVL